MILGGTNLICINARGLPMHIHIRGPSLNSKGVVQAHFSPKTSSCLNSEASILPPKTLTNPNRCNSMDVRSIWQRTYVLSHRIFCIFMNAWVCFRYFRGYNKYLEFSLLDPVRDHVCLRACMPVNEIFKIFLLIASFSIIQDVPRYQQVGRMIVSITMNI